MTEFKRGDVIDFTRYEATNRAVVLSVEGDMVVFARIDARPYRGLIESIDKRVCTLVSRPSRGGRLVEVDFPDLEAGDVYYAKRMKDCVGMGEYYRLVDAPAEPSVATCKRVLRAAIKAKVDAIGPQLTEIENKHGDLVEKRMTLVTMLATIDNLEED